ncbi:GNAT family N-acetyltransferase (plasmid) [Streptomyces sp. HU2014]|uniref:GNAT family N-acetyltransferase n=1 Tax=Streptomyces sp. HU2014 TaxID=2939414 RepID=UPI00200C7574|nr:GNAT family N-acetyltransferase [Streptomyces sp. HU2014]UQI49783.1 GNAT family N-acetyltransferase [Streptomyces sp. HU2014]
MSELIRQATPADSDALMKLRIDAEEWLASAGIDQWRSPGFRDRALAKWQVDVAEGRTWVVPATNSKLLGTITLARPDSDFWKRADSPESAVYVAKLITARSAAGQRLGGRLLDWAGSVARDRQLPWVRLDVWRDNLKLQGYYLNEGFEHVRTEAPSHRLSGWMAQRPSSLAMHADTPLRTVDTPRLAG